MHDAEERIARLTKQIEELVPNWSMSPVVEAFQAMRGVAFVAAVTVVAEVGDFARFDNQPAHESLLNRRLQPCPLPWTSSRNRAPGSNQNAVALSKPLKANMRAGC